MWPLPTRFSWLSNLVHRGLEEAGLPRGSEASDPQAGALLSSLARPRARRGGEGTLMGSRWGALSVAVGARAQPPVTLQPWSGDQPPGSRHPEPLWELGRQDPWPSPA